MEMQLPNWENCSKKVYCIFYHNVVLLPQRGSSVKASVWEEVGNSLIAKETSDSMKVCVSPSDYLQAIINSLEDELMVLS